MLTFSLRAALVAALATISALPSAAAAQGDDERARARAAFERGVDAYANERWEEALQAFQEAYRIAPHPSVRVNMANSYLHLGRPVEALDHFERFVIEGGEEADRAQLREVRRQIEELRGQIGEVFFRIQPEGATVTIDGHTAVRAPILDAMKLAAGTHHVAVAFSGRPTVEREFEVTGGGRSEVRIDLSEATETAAETGEATPADEGGEVDLDEALAPDEVAEATVEEDVEEAATEPEDEGEGFEVPLTAWITGGATVALAVTAVALGAAAIGANNDFDDAVARSNDGSLTPAERDQAVQDGLDSADRADRLALAADLIGVTAVLAAGATVFFILWQPGDDGDVALAPAAGPNGGGLSLRGSF